MNILQRAALLAAIGVAAIVAAGAYGAAPEAQAALGGPVILGGDDLTSHGGAVGGVNNTGWLYMQRALENIKPNVTRSNDNSVAALGSSATGGGAGSAILSAATAAGLTVTYYEGGPAITGFLTTLAPGGAAIIWIAGDDASNDLGDGDGLEAAALTANASAISGFVSSGGGLMSHGVEYGWLTALLPGATTVNNGSSDDLYFTPEGLVALPGLTVADINAGPWHNYFEGDFGGLQVLVRSSDIQDESGQDVAAILGGAQVTFEKNPATPPPAEPTATPKACIPPLVGIICTAPAGGGGSRPTATATAGTPAAVPPTSVPPTQAAPAQTQPSGGQAGVIRAPDTGDGSGTAGGGNATTMLLALSVAGIALAGAGAGALKLQARRRD